MEESELEEERRLAYVGITRAEEELFLTNAFSRTLYGRTQYNRPSRFVEEIEQDLLQSLGERTQPKGQLLPFSLKFSNQRIPNLVSPLFRRDKPRLQPAINGKWGKVNHKNGVSARSFDHRPPRI